MSERNQPRVAPHRSPPLGSPLTGAPGLRWTSAVASITVGLVLVGLVADAAADAARVAWLIGLAALALQALALIRWPGAAVASGALLGTLAAMVLLPASSRGSAVEVAVLFLATIELAAWSVQLRSVIPEHAGSIRRRLGEIGGVVAGGGLVSAAMLGVAHLEGPRGRAALVIGVSAAVVPVALLAARRWRAS